MRFHDRFEHLDYLKAELVARRIRETPEVILQARDHIARFWRDDPHCAHALATWEPLLSCAPEEIARRLLEDSPEGRYLRETRPAFGVTTAAEAGVLVARLRSERRDAA